MKIDENYKMYTLSGLANLVAADKAPEEVVFENHTYTKVGDQYIALGHHYSLLDAYTESYPDLRSILTECVIKVNAKKILYLPKKEYDIFNTYYMKVFNGATHINLSKDSLDHMRMAFLAVGDRRRRLGYVEADDLLKNAYAYGFDPDGTRYAIEDVRSYESYE